MNTIWRIFLMHLISIDQITTYFYAMLYAVANTFIYTTIIFETRLMIKWSSIFYHTNDE